MFMSSYTNAFLILVWLLLKFIFTAFVCHTSWGAFHQAFCQWFSLTNFISYWNPCIWLAESKLVSENHWQKAWWNAPPPPPNFPYKVFYLQSYVHVLIYKCIDWVKKHWPSGKEIFCIRRGKKVWNAHTLKNHFYQHHLKRTRPTTECLPMWSTCKKRLYPFLCTGPNASLL